jgi:cellulose synthase/poly-beta-1,6-N-acetylglucosamine synthase-like glycosyltransferase
MIVIGLIQLAAASLVLAHGTWWSLLSLVALKRPTLAQRQAALPLSLVVIVPAHDEEPRVARTIESLRRSSAGFDCEVLVVADNCHDRTADAARAAGATVLERFDSTQRGKPFALKYAMDALALRASRPDAVLIVDADTSVSESFVPALAGRLARGAEAVQAHYLPGAATTDLGRLRGLAFSLVHWARPLGASRLGLGTGLKGNGMGFRWDAACIATGGRGLAEDAAATLDLAASGIRVQFEPTASVSGLMAQTTAEARTQDLRWEGGRAAIARRAISVGASRPWRGDIATAAAAFEVASLPLSLLVLLSGASLLLAIAGQGSLVLASAGGISLVAYVVLGLAAARTPLSSVSSARGVPAFLLHKVGVYARLAAGKGPRGWQRTGRA